MAIYNLNVNGEKFRVDVDEGTALLWVLREHLELTGTKFGCGIAQCGACTIHIDGQPQKACILPVNSVANGQAITTIEGLSEDNNHPLQKAWIAEQVPQCGYCQSGQIMQAAALLTNNPNPNRTEIVQYMNGNLCRCGTYVRIIKAIQKAAEEQVALSNNG